MAEDVTTTYSSSVTESILQSRGMVQDFIDVTVDVVSTTTGLSVTPNVTKEISEAPVTTDVTTCKNITGVLRFSGDFKGAMLLTMTEETAAAAVRCMLGRELSDVNADVSDGVGELANMIAGAAKTKLQKKGIDFDLSYPSIVTGRGVKSVNPTSTLRTRFDFQANFGKFFIEVHLTKE